MAPIFDFSRVLARSQPETTTDGSTLNSPESYLGPSSSDTKSTTHTSTVKLSTGASIAVGLAFIVLMVSIVVTIFVCVRGTRRKAREARESKEVEMGNTFGDEDSTMGIVKGEMKKPAKIWAPWRR